jgi:predicted nucleic acid-binding protein
MKPGKRRERESVGVVDAGVVLARLDRRRPSHPEVVRLFERASRGRVSLHLSVVNLAEVLQHARAYVRVTGLDPLVLLNAFKVAIHSPGAEVAQLAADLSTTTELSLADRFAAGTAAVLGARLHTTDIVLAQALRKQRRPVTIYR